MEVVLVADGRTAVGGGGSMLMHNERLADPLDPFTRAMAQLTGKRKKTEADHMEIAHLEFLGSMYTNPVITSPADVNGQVPTIPAWNMVSCLQDGGKRHKRGADVLRGIYPRDEFATFEFSDPASGDPYSGPLGAEELWKAGTFGLRKGVVIGGRKTMRTRPLFTDWRASIVIEYDTTIFDLDTIRTIWSDAGKFSGLGDRRPVLGRFVGAVEENTARKERKK
jgi:hypothetical protein